MTAAALAHVNRLPVLLLPGDVFASRAPDPVLQQIEDFRDGTVSANDCFRPVSRYFDRIARPEQLFTALPRAFATMTDPAECGPVPCRYARTCRRRLMTGRRVSSSRASGVRGGHRPTRKSCARQSMRSAPRRGP